MKIYNLAVVLLAFASTFLLEKRWRAMCVGLWIGYGLLGVTVPELIYSHMYYSCSCCGHCNIFRSYKCTYTG